jgi:hypothetical protein
LVTDASAFRQLFDARLEIDDAGVDRNDPAVDNIVGDENIRLLMRENRIALAIGKINKLEETGATHADVPLMVTVHSHPECRFRWSRLIVDLSPTPGARIGDISPREVRGDKPVEIKTSVGIGFKFETAAKLLSAEVSPKVEQSRTVYYPDIVSSGLGTKKALWDFLALTSEYLHANRELRVLVSGPGGLPLKVRFTLRAKVKMQGFAGLIPLLAGDGQIEETYVLS